MSYLKKKKVVCNPDGRKYSNFWMYTASILG